MKRLVWLLGAAVMLSAWSQGPAKSDPFTALSFLQGTWEAKTDGANGVQSAGTYSFGLEMKGHVLARHAVNVIGCKGPADFDCQHGDMLYVFPEGPGLKAIYFDNEGHVIHYDVTTPELGTAMFLSDASQPGPQFRLMYVLRGGVMSGKFQMKMPGGSDWKSYLEWSGGRKN